MISLKTKRCSEAAVRVNAEYGPCVPNEKKMQFSLNEKRILDSDILEKMTNHTVKLQWASSRMRC